MSFTKVVEDFTCEHCKADVQGAGYTNHCPVCLWSKHVDVDPGDRAETCGGSMRPMRVVGSSPDYRIVHRCLECGVERTVKTDARDDAEALIELASTVAHS